MPVILLSHRQRMVKQNKTTENNFRLSLNGLLTAFREDVHSILSAKEYIPPVIGENGADIELPLLQTVKMVVIDNGEIIMITLTRHRHLCHALIGGNPNVPMMVFSNGTGHRSTQTVIGNQFIEFIVQFVENIET